MTAITSFIPRALRSLGRVAPPLHDRGGRGRGHRERGAELALHAHVGARARRAVLLGHDRDLPGAVVHLVGPVAEDAERARHLARDANGLLVEAGRVVEQGLDGGDLELGGLAAREQRGEESERRETKHAGGTNGRTWRWAKHRGTLVVLGSVLRGSEAD